MLSCALAVCTNSVEHCCWHLCGGVQPGRASGESVWLQVNDCAAQQSVLHAASGCVD
jgi:hypothetical protein